ncbi:MAG: 50S ribosomal protein L11 methyltransferase [Burkholderiales bacterium]|nr:50S ribosomal protein L11 methyltransferase [Burkholderiales bacterium]
MFELVLRAPEALVETLSDALVDELEALSVTVEDADAGTDGERALFGEPGMPAPAAGWERSTIRALFESEHAAEAAAAVLLAQAWMQAPQAGAAAQPAAFVQALQAVPEQDWVRLTQSQFAPVPITADFWIVPSWHEPPAEARRLIRLDPGLAFGTGTHATTRMCLRWLAREAPAQAAGWTRVLDYGCGSGILAIAAAKLGARGVDAVDIDPAAVRATADNAERNGVELQAALPDQDGGGARGAYPLVLANILATPLKLLAPLLAGHLAPGGWLVLAGILERQAAELRAAYAPHLAIEVLDTDEGWVLMGGRAAGAATPTTTPTTMGPASR